jgi:TolB-like protein/DNA-binding winged helix-turn-helix (wHTH) protein
LKPLNPTPLRIGDWRADPTVDEISREGSVVKLEPRAMRLLIYLAERAGQVVSVEELLADVWSGVIVTSDSVYQAVAALRRILGDDSKNPQYIATLPRRGYRLIASVVPWSDAASEVLPAAEAGSAVAVPATLPLGRRIGAWHRWLAIVALAAIVGYFAIERVVSSRRIAPSSSREAATTVAAPENSIAVLPFVDLSEKKDQEYFSDGLSEELIDLLSQVEQLHVPARTSSFSFKGKPATIGEIAKVLSVGHVLEGSVRRSGSHLRVTAQLVRADTGFHVWSQTFDRGSSDIFELQDEIANAVVAALKIKLLPQQQPASQHRTENLEAYNDYLLGRELHGRDTSEASRESIAAFKRAIALDPGYGAAYAALAMAEFRYLVNTKGETSKTDRDQIVSEAETSVRLAPTLAEAYSARGYVRVLYAHQVNEGLADLQTALSLDPRDATTLRRYASVLDSLGRESEALVMAREAVRSNPLDSYAYQMLVNVLDSLGDYTGEREALEHLIEVSPDSVMAPYLQAGWDLRNGHAERALAFYAGRPAERERLYGTAMAQFTLGHEAESRQALATYERKYGKPVSHDTAWDLALIHTWRGEKSEAIDWLERIDPSEDPNLYFIDHDSRYQSLRDQPRFTALVQKLRASRDAMIN